MSVFNLFLISAVILFGVPDVLPIIVIILTISCETQNTELEVEITTPVAEIIVEEPIDYEEWWHQISRDSIYKDLIAFNTRDLIKTDIDVWLDVFIRDAKRVADLDLSYAYENEINFEFLTGGVIENQGRVALARAACDDNLIDIAIAPNLFINLLTPFEGQEFTYHLKQSLHL